MRIRVEVNETLGHYADWAGCSLNRIRQMNRLWRRGLKVNQSLLLPMNQEKVEQFNAQRLEYHMALEEDFYSQYRVEGTRTRKVRYGETLWSICNGNNHGNDLIPLWLFKKYNRDVNIEKIGNNTQVQLPIIKGRD